MDPTRSALYERLFDELAETGASDLAADLALAAFEGADVLDGVLGGITTSRPEPNRRAHSDASAVPGMYLTSISVRGFRGVGPMKTLSLRPGPGLTLITGRNGSGKSSFAEAVELALTGTNERLQRGRIWRDGWRNLHLHCDEAPRIEVELTAEGAPRPLRVLRAWQADDTDLLAATTTVRLPGESARPLSDLPWQEALADFRPFLAYSELSGLITDGNAKIFDAMGGLLRLRELTDTHTLLQQAHSKLDKAHQAVRDGRTALLAALAASTDTRAKVISTALASKVSKAWDLDAARAAVGGAGVDGAGAGGSTTDEVTTLRRLVALTAPDPAEVADRAARLRTAVAGADAASGTPAADARRVAGLLRAGLRHYQEHGGGACPLCGVGALDEAWHASATAEAERLGVLAKEADDADVQLRDAFTSALTLIEKRPGILSIDQADGPVADSADRARAAWETWERLRVVDAPGTLADDLVSRHEALLATVDTLRSTARARLEVLETAWSPVARQTLEWLDAARRGRTRQPLLAALKEACDFLKALLERLRDERLAPFAAQQQAIWAELRQESNVDLGPMRLRGTATRRRLVLDVTVDGAGGTALGVMSQGELHALGLALFLPRATVPESPFRFVVIDDPVQAMDPAKVDGLARVLLRTAETRQVVVFTHDDRLADAVRRFSTSTIPARQVDVIRAEQSVVEIRPALDPAGRWLEEARALAYTGKLPDDIKSALVPAFCRSAVDAVCTDIYRRRRLAAGDRHHEVETAITAARRTGAKAALAIFSDTSREHKVVSYISNKWGWSAGSFYKNLKEAGHESWGGDLIGLVRESTDLVSKLGELR